ncbi:MAG: YkgJ family cysteine cluster protein [Candidatus Thorarchaeota archaeon]
MPSDYRLRPQHDGAGIRFQCTKCGTCCSEKSLIVTLTGHDIVRLARGLRLTAAQLLRALDFYLLSDDESPPEGLTRFPAVRTDRGMVYIALKKSNDGRCVFLDNNLCMIHPIRPSACAAFPFVFTRDRTTIRWGLSAKRDICPGIGEGNEVSEAELLQLAGPVLEELDEYHKFAETWNRQWSGEGVIELVEAILQDSRFQ